MMKYLALLALMTFATTLTASLVVFEEPPEHKRGQGQDRRVYRNLEVVSAPRNRDANAGQFVGCGDRLKFPYAPPRPSGLRF